MKTSSLFAGVVATLAGIAHGQDILSIHGSGTTNPSKCYWRLISQFTEQVKVLIHMSYRAVGSSTGQFEFVGENNTVDFGYTSWNDWGSGDIPVKTVDFDKLAREGKEMVHLPIFLGAISFFHSIPGVESGTEGLNVTGCVLARIFNRKITTWDHPEILEDNKRLKEKLPRANYPITVAHRVLGSSSTASITEYLNTVCPQEWPITMVGSKIVWPADTDGCQGSAGMTTCLRQTEGAIGYLDSGHGHDEGLVEVELINRDGKYLSSKFAAAKGGIASAADEALKLGVIPARADENFGNVKLLNMPGEYTWPIVAMTYVYAKKDLSHFRSDGERSFFVHFLKTLYDLDFIGQCEVYGFTLPPQSIRDLGLAGIDMLQLPAGSTEWIVETDTRPGVGQGDNVISFKRKSFSNLQISGLSDDVMGVQESVGELSNDMTATTFMVEDHFLNNGDDDRDDRIQSALVLGGISIALWGIVGIMFLIKKLVNV